MKSCCPELHCIKLLISSVLTIISETKLFWYFPSDPFGVWGLGGEVLITKNHNWKPWLPGGADLLVINHLLSCSSQRLSSDERDATWILASFWMFSFWKKMAYFWKNCHSWWCRQLNLLHLASLTFLFSKISSSEAKANEVLCSYSICTKTTLTNTKTCQQNLAILWSRRKMLTVFFSYNENKTTKCLQPHPVAGRAPSCDHRIVALGTLPFYMRHCTVHQSSPSPIFWYIALIISNARFLAAKLHVF